MTTTTLSVVTAPIPEQAAISPDGARVVYVLRQGDAALDRDARSLWTVPSDGGDARRLTRGDADSAPVFSPDGSTVAFLRTVDGAPQLATLPLDGGEVEVHTRLPLGAGPATYTPDGSSLVFAAAVDAAAAASETAADGAARRAGAPRSTRELGYKFDGAGWLGAVRPQLHVLDLATGAVRRITDEPGGASSPVLSPDGTAVAYATTTGADGGMLVRSRVRAVGLDGSDQRDVGPDDARLGPTAWRDASTVVAVGRADLEIGNAGLFLLSGSAEPVNLAAPLDRNVMAGSTGYPGGPALVAGDAVVFCARDNGWSNLFRTGPDGPEPLLAGDLGVSGLSLGGGRAVTTVTTADSFGEVVVVDLADGRAVTLTDHGADAPTVVPAVQRDFELSDGSRMTGWVRRSPSTTGASPLLLDVHGGPHNAWNGAADGVHAYHHELVEHGWTVLTLNPRGSDGYGEAFMRAVLGGWGSSDHADLLEAVDALVADGTADPDRLAVTGYSYGGFMTAYLTSRDGRFAAAVAGGPVIDPVSEGGTSDVGHYIAVQDMLACTWTDAGRAALAEQSPYARVGDVSTPTLILHGAADDRCPVGQAEQWFSALRERGVESELVVYPGGSHDFFITGPVSHRVDWAERVTEWVRRHTATDAVGATRPVDAARWQARLDALAVRHRVPGVSLGVLRLGEEPVVVSHGVTSVRTGVEVTPDTVFQIGSITKVWTATVAMQLVDEGLLQLDAPILDVLPELRLADPEAQSSLTLRHLLNHTNGIDGDVFTDTGRGDDCLAIYTELLAGEAQNHPLGVTFSYSNSGFNLLGRVIERVTGKTWDQAMRERLFEPLGLEHTVTLPEEALLHRAAVGHVEEDEQGRPVATSTWMLPRSDGPSGVVTASAADVLEFAAMHLRGGTAADGTRLLSADTVRRMQDTEVVVPSAVANRLSWGLGWILFDWDGPTVIGHDGNTIGQSAFLKLLPEHGIAITVLTNGGYAEDLADELTEEILGELAGIVVPPAFAPPAEPVETDFTRWIGRYERASVLSEVFELDGRPHVRARLTGPLAEVLPNTVMDFPLVPVADGLYATRPEGSTGWSAVVFYQLPTGEPYLHMSLRAAPRVDA